MCEVSIHFDRVRDFCDFKDFNEFVVAQKYQLFGFSIDNFMLFVI